MAVVIDSELVNFKNKVSSSLSSMNTALTTLTSKISELVSINTSTQSSISSVYVSENQAEILSKFDKINNIYNKINTSLESDLNSILTKSSSLIDKITVLEKLQQEIIEQEERIRNVGSKWSYNEDRSNKSEVDAHNSEIDRVLADANSILNTKTSEFNTLHNEALSYFSNLKALDASFSFVSEFTSVDLSTISQYLTGNSLQKYTYTASNGETFDYYLYIPEYSTNVDKLPVHVYLHGYGEDEKDGLTALLGSEVKPNGIVICPQSPDGKWNDNNCEDALIELIDKVVEDTNADSNRISLSGNSRGAIGGYRLISRYPDYFSAYVPISGHCNKMEKTESGWDSLGNVKIWAFHGTNDNMVYYSGATGAQAELEKRGYDNMEIYTWEGAGHGIQTDILSGTYEYNGEKYNPVEWAMSQTKNQN